ncbi:septum formation family protein [Streptomyces sp. S.PB5]|uniref:septum formation family protein n=1 Tax=Streptomyces sp. S.PB5 TaxID=3020844 RepID=UPI0025B0C4D2|nr:septum formation family protein [Streptomyces sp. S.PB5]MDN3026032.1 septum formation family protein [Streptomyces sp. S.PB5]
MRKSASLLGAAGLVLLTGCGASVDSAAPAVPTVMQTVGTCHTFRIPQEMVQPSDIAPPVPCDRPHRSETFQVLTVGGPLATWPTRPEPEQLQEYVKNLCSADELRQYLGGGPRDTVAFSVWVRFPTRAEWAGGVRTMRCEAVPPVQKPEAGPLMAVPARDVLRRTDSAAVRNCEHGTEVVTCDRPHDREEVNAWLDLKEGAYPENVQAAAADVCRPFVEEFVGVRLKSAPALTIKARTPTENEWAGGTRTVRCGVGPAETGATITGTLSATAKGQA